MPTKCSIIVEHANGTWRSVQCESDGDLEGVGQALHRYYPDQTRAERLVAEGDISFIFTGAGLRRSVPYSLPAVGYVLNYDRDTRARVRPSLDAVWPSASGWAVSFVYVWKRPDAAWFFGRPRQGPGRLTPLAAALPR